MFFLDLERFHILYITVVQRTKASHRVSYQRTEQYKRHIEPIKGTYKVQLKYSCK